MAFRQSPPTLSRFVALAALLALTLALTTLAHEHTHSDPDVRYKPVTCGSNIKLRHKATQYLLFSQPVNIASPSGSGQQSVTAGPDEGDSNAYWQINEGHGSAPCTYGTPFRCGDVVRFTHAFTNVKLHSHSGYKAPISGRQEVTGFGGKGESNEEDNWIVECDDKYWYRERPVKFAHATTGAYLYAQKDAQFTHNNCPGCPFVGRLEVSALKGSDFFMQWLADDGVYYSQITPNASEQADKQQKDEL